MIIGALADLIAVLAWGVFVFLVLLVFAFVVGGLLSDLASGWLK